MGCWGHLVLRPESGSQETEPQTQTTDPSSGSHGTKAFGEGTRGSHRIVPVSKDDIKQTHSGSNPHTPLSASLRQIILFCYQFSSVFKKRLLKKLFILAGGVIEKHIKVVALYPGLCDVCCAVPCGPPCEAEARRLRSWGLHAQSRGQDRDGVRDHKATSSLCSLYISLPLNCLR